MYMRRFSIDAVSISTSQNPNPNLSRVSLQPDSALVVWREETKRKQTAISATF